MHYLHLNALSTFGRNFSVNEVEVFRNVDMASGEESQLFSLEILPGCYIFWLGPPKKSSC